MKSIRPYLNDPARYPRLVALTALADRCVDEGLLDDLVHVCRDAFDAVLTSEELADIVCMSLQALAEGMDQHPEWLSKTAEEWVIADTAHYSLRLAARKPKNSKLFHSLNFDCIVGNASGPDLDIDVHSIPEGVRLDEFIAGALAPFDHEVRLRAGTSCTFSARRDVPLMKMSTPVLLMTLYSKRYVPLIWSFDRDSFQSGMAMASHDSPVRRQAGAAMLQHLLLSESLAPERSLHTLAGLAADEAHFVRWSALQAMCAIDMDYARSFLVAAMNDPHPTVATAARRAVNMHLQPEIPVEA